MNAPSAQDISRADPRRMVGAVTEPQAVRRLLAALGLAAEPPPMAAARR